MLLIILFKQFQRTSIIIISRENWLSPVIQATVLGRLELRDGIMACSGIASTTRRNEFCGRTKDLLLGEGLPRRSDSSDERRCNNEEAGIRAPACDPPTLPDTVLNTVIVPN